MNHVYPHRIRLRGPWECEPLARYVLGPGRFEEYREGLPEPRRITMPDHWRNSGLEEFTGRVRFLRKFGYPGRIDDFERVWLAIDGTAGPAAITLNGQLLDPNWQDWDNCPLAYEVTGLLRPHNGLVVEMGVFPGMGDPWKELALEIRRTAYLRDVVAWVSRQEEYSLVEVTGKVVGSSERMLDLYVLLAEQTIAYGAVKPTAEGVPFNLKSRELDRDLREGSGSLPAVRVELVEGGVIWYTVEVPCQDRLF
jgi:hypothetical protein